MNLKGGYKILILPVLSLVAIETSITDKEVLEQLKGLLTYSGKKELKPILIHCGIEESSKVTKHCVMGELKKISDTEYVIIAKIDKAYLTISVEFTLDSETEEYYIASGDAKYLLTKSTSIDGDLEVSGDALIGGGVTSKGIANTGNIANTGDIATVGKVTGGEIVENMTGYSFTKASDTTYNTFSYVYAGVVKNGNKLTMAIAFNVTKLINTGAGICGDFTIPTSVYLRLYPVSISGNSYLARGKVQASDQSDLSYYDIPFSCYLAGDSKVRFTFNNTNISVNGTAYIRIEVTFLLSENLASE